MQNKSQHGYDKTSMNPQGFGPFDLRNPVGIKAYRDTPVLIAGGSFVPWGFVAFVVTGPLIGTVIARWCGLEGPTVAMWAFNIQLAILVGVPLLLLAVFHFRNRVTEPHAPVVDQAVTVATTRTRRTWWHTALGSTMWAAPCILAGGVLYVGMHFYAQITEHVSVVVNRVPLHDVRDNPTWISEQDHFGYLTIAIVVVLATAFFLATRSTVGATGRDPRNEGTSLQR